jgi:hypothetical protein
MKRSIILMAIIGASLAGFSQTKNDSIPVKKEVKQEVKDSVDNNTILLSVNDINASSKALGDYLSDKLSKKDWDMVFGAITQFNQRSVDAAIARFRKKK